MIIAAMSLFIQHVQEKSIDFSTNFDIKNYKYSFWLFAMSAVAALFALGAAFICLCMRPRYSYGRADSHPGFNQLV